MSHLHPHFALRLQRRARPLMSARGLRQMAAPWRFYSVAGRLVRWLAVLAALGLAAAALAGHLGAASALAVLQPAASFTGGGLYLLMAMAAAAGLLGIGRMTPIMVAAGAPTSALLLALGLVPDGAWQAQGAPEAVLLPFTLGVVLVQGLVHSQRRADQIAAVLVLAGACCSAAVRLFAALPALPSPGWTAATWLSLLAVAAYAGAVVLQRARLEIVERGRRLLLDGEVS